MKDLYPNKNSRLIKADMGQKHEGLFLYIISTCNKLRNNVRLQIHQYSAHLRGARFLRLYLTWTLAVGTVRFVDVFVSTGGLVLSRPCRITVHAALLGLIDLRIRRRHRIYRSSVASDCMDALYKTSPCRTCSCNRDSSLTWRSLSILARNRTLGLRITQHVNIIGIRPYGLNAYQIS